MTDRRVGGTGANVDITAQSDRRTSGLGVQVDAVPPQTFERQIDGLSLMIDAVPPTGDVATALGVSVDLVAASPRMSGALAALADIVPTRVAQFGSMGVMVDYVLSLIPTTAARWSGALFEMGTASPLTYWSAGAFQSSGTSLVVWQTDHFGVAP